MQEVQETTSNNSGSTIRKEVVAALRAVDISKINLDTAYQFRVTDSGTIEGTATDVFDWYKVVYPTWYMVYYPVHYPTWTQTQYADTTRKALDIVKKLKDRKLLKVKNVKDFIDIVDIVRKTL